MTIHKLFIKLLLKNTFFWNDKLKLGSNLIIKSFYKNAELEILPSILNINKKLLTLINNQLFESKYIYKLICFIYLKNSISQVISSTKYISTITMNTKIINLLHPNKLIILGINNNTTISEDTISVKLCYLYNLIYYVYTCYSHLLNSKMLCRYNWKTIRLPKNSEKITILRSPHIDKKSREQFEIVTHKSRIAGLNLLGDTTIGYLKSKSNSSYISVVSSYDNN